MDATKDNTQPNAYHSVRFILFIVLIMFSNIFYDNIFCLQIKEVFDLNRVKINY